MNKGAKIAGVISIASILTGVVILAVKGKGAAASNSKWLAISR